MNKLKLLMTAVLTLSLGYIFAQENFTQNVKGLVVDATSKSPIPGANVIIENTDPLLGAVTDFDGKFVIKNVNTGRVSIRISFVGYKTVSLNNLELLSGKELFVNVEMIENIVTTDVVEIKATYEKTKADNDFTTVSGRSFSIEETNRYAGSLGDPSRMAQNFAGVVSAGDSRNDIVIRGNSPTGLLWRLEGVEIPNPNHFGALGTTGGPVSMLNNNLLTNSDFFTGAFPAEYGNALSGVFDLKMRTGNTEKFEFLGQIGFNGFEAGIEGPFSKKFDGSFFINYRYSTPALVDKLGLSMITGNSVPNYQDLTFKADLPTKKAGSFTLFGIAGKSNIKIYDSEKDSTEFSYGLSGTDTDFGSQMAVAGLSHVYFIGKNTRIKTSLSYSNSSNYTDIDSLPDVETDPKKPFLRRDYQESKLSVKTNVRHKISAKDMFVIGIDASRYILDYQDSVNLDNTTMKNVVNVEGNLMLYKGFFQYQHKFSEVFRLNAGVHSQLFSLNNEISLEPRAGLEWDFTEKQSLSFGYGNHAQTQPRMIYFYETEVNGENVRTNEDLKFTKSNQFVLGYNNRLSTNFRIKVEAYYQSLYNAPVSTSLQDYSVLNEGAYFTISLVDSLVNKGTGKNYGLELTIEKFLSKNYYFLVTTSLFNSTYKGYNGNEHSTAFNNNYVINALGGYEYKFSKRASLTSDLKGVLAGGKRDTPVDEAASATSNATQYIWEKAYSVQHEDYFRLDLRLAFKLSSKKTTQEWALEIQNITDHQNVFLKSWDSSTKSMRTDYQQGLYPMFMYRINF